MIKRIYSFSCNILLIFLTSFSSLVGGYLFLCFCYFSLLYGLIVQKKKKSSMRSKLDGGLVIN